MIYRAAELWPVMLGIGHPQHDPTMMGRFIDVPDRVPHGFALGPYSVLAGDQTTGDIKSQCPHGGIVERYLQLLGHPGFLPYKKGRHNARQEAQRRDTISIPRS